MAKETRVAILVVAAFAAGGICGHLFLRDWKSEPAQKAVSEEAQEAPGGTVTGGPSRTGASIPEPPAAPEESVSGAKPQAVDGTLTAVAAQKEAEALDAQIPNVLAAAEEKPASTVSPQSSQSGRGTVSKFAITELDPRISLYLPERARIVKTSVDSDIKIRQVQSVFGVGPGEHPGMTRFELVGGRQAMVVTDPMDSREGAYSADCLSDFVEVGNYQSGRGARAYRGLCYRISDGLLDVRQAADHPPLIFSDDGILSAGSFESDVAFTVTGPSDGFVSFFMECDGVTHLYTSKAEPWKGFTFEGDETYPLTFKKVRGRGYVYLCGRGTVTLKDGKTIRLGDTDTVDAWLSECKSSDTFRREGAAQALGFLAKNEAERKKAVSALIPLLQDQSLEVRRNAAEALGNLGDVQAIDALTALVGKIDTAWGLESTPKGMGAADFRHTKCQTSWVSDVASEALAKLREPGRPAEKPQVKTEKARETTAADVAKVEPIVKALEDSVARKDKLGAEARLAELEKLIPYDPRMEALRTKVASVPRPGKTVDLGGGVKMELVLIGPGSSMAGSEDGENDEKPVHGITITKPFYIGKYEVTQAQWQAVMGNNPSAFKGDGNPVDNVSWNDSQNFIARLNEKIPQGGFRLPTEAEWEYACRAGNSAAYCYGDDLGQLRDYAWYSGNSNSTTHPAGQKKPNAWGLFDMHGNVWEWCGDWHGDYPSGSIMDPTGPSTGQRRVLRGGSWYLSPDYCRSANRNDIGPMVRNFNYGVRVVRGL